MKTSEFVKAINSMRLENKNKWYYFNTNVNGLSVQIKAYGTWLQIFNVGGVNYSNVMDQSITEFKAHLKNGVEHETN